MPSKVLVAGAGGYIGEAVAHALRRAGFSVSGIVRSEAKAVELERAEITALVGDYADAKFVPLMKDYAVIIDAVGWNDQATHTFLQNALQAGKKRVEEYGPLFKSHYIFTSGIMTIGHAADNLHGGRLDHLTQVDESVPPVPASSFVVARKEFEDKVLSLKELNTTVIRPGWVFGSHGGPYVDGFFRIDPSAEKLVLQGSLDKRWSWVHVDDVASAYVLAVERVHVSAGQLFNVATAEAPTYGELRYALARAAGWKGTRADIVSQPAPPEMATMEATVIVDSAKARRLLGWEPKHAGFLSEVDTYFKSWQRARGGAAAKKH